MEASHRPSDATLTTTGSKSSNTQNDQVASDPTAPVSRLRMGGSNDETDDTNGTYTESQRQGKLAQWLILIGAFSVTTATLGVTNAVGLMQQYLEKYQLATYEPRDIGWIAATNIFLTLSLPVLAGPLYDRYGHRWLLLLGTVIFVLGIFVTSFMHGDAEPPQVVFGVLLLTWGGLCGSGTGIITMAVTGVIVHAFDRRRGFASGFVFMGSSVGGVAWPMVLRCTLDRWGWGVAIRIVAGASTLLLVLGNLLIRGTYKGARNRSFVSSKCLRQPDFLLVTAGLAVFQFIVMGVVGTLPSWGTKQGFNRELIFDVVAVMNGGSGVGRVATGVMSDKIGRFNSILATQFLAIVVVFGMFLNVGGSVWRFYLFAPLWGFCAGAILSMTTVLIGQLCQKNEFGMYYGTNSLVISFA